MLNKFIATTIIPTAETIMDAWEGDSTRIQAVVPGDIPAYVEMKKHREGKGFDYNVPLETALREDGPCYIVHSNIQTAEVICERLHEELMEQTSYLVEQHIEEGSIGIPLAEDVLRYIKQEAHRVTNELLVNEAATTTAEGESMMADEELVEMMAASGLTVGMKIHLGTVAASIERFVPTVNGVSVVLKTGKKETVVSATDVIAVIQTTKQEEESNMTQGTTLKLNATTTTTTKEEVTMTNNTIANEEAIAQSKAAAAFLANTTPVAPATEVAAPVEQPVPAGVSFRLPSQTQNSNNQEAMNMTNNTIVNTEVAAPVVPATQAPVAPVSAPAPTVPTVPTVAGPSLSIRGGAGNVSGPVAPTAIQSGLSDVTKRYMSSPDASQTQGTSLRIPMKPWYLEDSLQGVIKGSEIDNHIVEVTLPNGAKEIRLRNADLGVDLVALSIADMFAAGKMKFLPSDYQLIVELKMANDSVVIPFQIGIYGPGYNRYENDVVYGRKLRTTPIFANNIKRSEYKGRWTSELMLSTKNQKQHAVKCTCGHKNTFRPESFAEVKDGNKVVQYVGRQICWNDKCKKELVVAEVAQDASGNTLEMTSQNYVQNRLPFGFQFGEEVLAQVMAFAHVVLEDSFTLGK